MVNLTESLQRNIGCLDRGEQERLLHARVTVCGCGGLGGQTVENIARIGVGFLNLIDPDLFAVSNLNRQLGALSDTLGKNKAAVLAERVRKIHSSCRAQVFAMDFRSVPDLGCPDVVVDCLDTIGARLELARICRKQDIPLVHGAVNGWYGQVGVQLPGKHLLETLYPVADKQYEPPAVLSVTVGVTAALQAAETVKLLLGKPSRLTEGWLNIDLLQGDFEFFS